MVKRLRKLAENDYEKMMVEFFDDKLGVVAAILFNLDVALSWTFQES